MRPKVKICCISSLEEARMAVEYGADVIGLVGAMPSGPGVIADGLIREITVTVPPPIRTFLLTSETTAAGIVQHHRKTGTDTIQLVDKPEEGTYVELRRSIPDVRLVQVIHVIDQSSVEEAITVSSEVDALLLDSGNPSLKVKELGGTGRIHDWKLSRKIVEFIDKPVFLAGGLNPENAKRAVDEVGPWGLDVCSGVRTNGILDRHKLEDFFKAIE